MKKVVVGILLALFALPAFAKQPQEVKVKVKVNKEVTSKGGMKIAFVELVEDSRCPVDVECIWAGNAKIRVRVTKNGKSKILELNTMERGEAQEFAGHRFELTDLFPKLRSNVRINRNAYEATIEITKSRQGMPKKKADSRSVPPSFCDRFIEVPGSSPLS